MTLKDALETVLQQAKDKMQVACSEHKISSQGMNVLNEEHWNIEMEYISGVINWVMDELEEIETQSAGA